MGDDDAVLRDGPALLDDDVTVRFGHLEAIDHHERPHFQRKSAATEVQHLSQVRVLEKEAPFDFVVPLVEGAAGDEEPNWAA